MELATLAWVHWYNEQRLHEFLDYVPPAEFEAARREKRAPCGPQSPAIDAGGSTEPGEMTLSGQL